jgi:hypothetical protein
MIWFHNISKRRVGINQTHDQKKKNKETIIKMEEERLEDIPISNFFNIFFYMSSVDHLYAISMVAIFWA